MISFSFLSLRFGSYYCRPACIKRKENYFRKFGAFSGGVFGWSAGLEKSLEHEWKRGLWSKFALKIPLQAFDFRAT
ncbi:hypothetical protein CH371_04510 [Leptospira wolffii]|uniref:Uncharacterized protein n=1 Tax=Leptospira wolffii TaxID=409998 RepID=A0A2M9ZFU2_9LEPT|nr:hypothetical protein CH371_04510 [Leptospira wolffii]